MTDLEREHLINWHAGLLLRCCDAGLRELGREHWQRMCELICERSAEQVERMERVFNDGTEASGQHISSRAGMPSPNQDWNAQGEARLEK